MALNAQDIGTLFSKMFVAMNAQLGAMSTALIADGQDLAGVLLFISTGIIVLFWLISGDGAKALVDWFGTILRFGVVSVLLVGWVGWIGGGLETGANEIAGKVMAAAGTGSSGSSSADVLKDAATTILVAAGRLMENERNTSDVPGADGFNFIEYVKDVFQSPLLLTAILMSGLIRMVAALFLAIMLAALVAVLVLAQVMFGLSLIIGPILVPWLIWERTEFLFDGWLKFTIAAMLTKVVAAVLTTIVLVIVLSVKGVAEHVITSRQDIVSADMLAAVCICIFSAIGAFLMWQVPNLANAFMSGGTATAQKFGQGFIARRLLR